MPSWIGAVVAPVPPPGTPREPPTAPGVPLTTPGATTDPLPPGALPSGTPGRPGTDATAPGDGTDKPSPPAAPGCPARSVAVSTVVPQAAASSATSAARACRCLIAPPRYSGYRMAMLCSGSPRSRMVRGRARSAAHGGGRALLHLLGRD